MPKLSNLLEVEVRVLYDNLHITTRKFLGNIFCNLGKYELAMTMYFKALHLGPRRHDVYFCMGRTLLFMGNTKEAIKYIEKSLQGDNNNHKYLELLFQANLQKDKYNHKHILSIN